MNILNMCFHEHEKRWIDFKQKPQKALEFHA